MTTKSGAWVLSEGHTVTYTTTTERGWFAQNDCTYTVYRCSCGRWVKDAGPARKATAGTHGGWPTPEERAEQAAWAASVLAG